VVLIGTPMQAAAPATPEGTEEVSIVAGRYSPNEIICKKVPPVLGTRLGGGKLCATRRSWDARRWRDRADLEDAQARRTRGPTGWW
jgi:hypothetical protein